MPLQLPKLVTGSAKSLTETYNNYASEQLMCNLLHPTQTMQCQKLTADANNQLGRDWQQTAACLTTNDHFADMACN